MSWGPRLCENYHFLLPPSSLILLHLPSSSSCSLLLPHFSSSPVHGVVDLVRLPYNQYQEDGRIMWGLQQGASSFSTSTGVAVVELTSRTLETLQVCILAFFRALPNTKMHQLIILLCIIILYEHMKVTKNIGNDRYLVVKCACTWQHFLPWYIWCNACFFLNSQLLKWYMTLWPQLWMAKVHKHWSTSAELPTNHLTSGRVWPMPMMSWQL